MKAIRLLLYPFALLYGTGVYIRNLCFDMGILSTKRRNFPLINVGNLAAGGTGKSPHVEYLVRLLAPRYKIATLSRGYGRKTSGFMEVKANSTFFDVGDEPSMFKSKFPELNVYVDATRNRGIDRIEEDVEGVDCIILDDAYQHRYVLPGLNILLTEYSRLYINDYLLPTGYLREGRSGAKRADIIIVTKCPQIFSPVDARAIAKSLKIRPYQSVYFSYFKYGDLVSLYKPEEEAPKLSKKMDVVLATGIAKPASMVFTLKEKVKHIEHIKFPDHHIFTMSDVNRIVSAFQALQSENKIILTTEKDAMRFRVSGIEEVLGDFPLYYLPVEVDFHVKNKGDFDENILTYVKRNIRSN